MAIVQLTPREAARVTVLAVLPVFCLVPSLVRLVLPSDPMVPAPICADEVGRVGGAVVCRSGAPVPPIEALWAGSKLDLNAASAALLEVVPGIGPRLAERIVDDRREHGPFASVEDTRRVKGIGPKLAARLAGYVTVRPSDRPTPRPSP